MFARCTSALVFSLLAILACREASAQRPVGRPTAIACAPSRAEVVATVVEGWIWETTDGGGSWRRMARLPEEFAVRETDGDGTGGPGPEMGVIPGREEGGLFTSGAGEEGASVAESEEDGDRAGVSLAVADDGRWAAAASGELITGGPGPGVTRSRPTEGVVGILFDGQGVLWVVAEERLHAVVDGGVVGRWSVPGAGVPARGGRGGSVIVPGRDGVRVVESSGTAWKPVLAPLGTVEAVAVAGADRWILARRGRLVLVVAGDARGDSAGFPFRVVELVAGSGGRVAAMDEEGDWWELVGGLARPASFSAVRTDVSGRMWTGTSAGPSAPSFEDVAAVGMDAPSMVLAMTGVERWIERNPGAPPCPSIPFNPVPVARLVAGFGRGEVAAYGIPSPVEVGRSRTWIYVGLRLVWSLGPVDRTSCVSRVEGWARRRAASMDRAARLWMEWRRARARAESAKDPFEAFVSRNESEMAAQLLRVSGGEVPAENGE